MSELRALELAGLMAFVAGWTTMIVSIESDQRWFFVSIGTFVLGICTLEVARRWYVRRAARRAQLARLPPRAQVVRRR
jgi:hypothetical protein